ncbi:hypothetical protein M3Y98_00430700 [Aphelenchoides besseyi]|nr:hypothetical protein M3Y98_00430700 [Aphelenchoides besseyi]KAI6202298.1 hypothetical protein M3Y96_00933200 [Aphelenchoides besseyi]
MGSQSLRRFSTPKSYPRSARAETRNRAKDELKRVINAVDRVRKWFVMIRFDFDQISIQGKAMDFVERQQHLRLQMGTNGPTSAAKTTTQKTAALLSDRANSTENSNDATNTLNSHFGMNEESNTAFSEGFESDSNQASEQGIASSSNGASTDFSAMVREEKETKTITSKPAK